MMYNLSDVINDKLIMTKRLIETFNLDCIMNIHIGRKIEMSVVTVGVYSDVEETPIYACNFCVNKTYDEMTNLLSKAYRAARDYRDRHPLPEE